MIGKAASCRYYWFQRTLRQRRGRLDGQKGADASLPRTLWVKGKPTPRQEMRGFTKAVLLWIISKLVSAFSSVKWG